MPIEKLLVANRGEIAIRVMRAARELGIVSVAVHSPDDAASLHVRRADESRALPGAGARGYLDIKAVVEAAKAADCDAVHPGYGFLAENAAFARRCSEEGITFVGPSVGSLELFGDKAQARNLAVGHDVPVLPGSADAVGLDEARSFFASLGEDSDVEPAMVIKAIAGGGGRGMRVVTDAAEIEEAYTRTQSEAGAAFGNDAVFVERLIARARHIEVQVIGDGQGGVAHLGERECSLQRRHQKVVELAPSPWLSDATRDRITAAAVRMAAAVNYLSLGTFEFLVDEGDESNFAFIEANPRLQVEHTVTEEVTGVDLVKAQLRIAGGASLADLGLEQDAIPAARGHAIQCRVNMERMQPDGEVHPSGGMLTSFEPPLGPGVRVDTYGYPGYTTNPNFDSLLAKVITYSALGRLRRGGGAGPPGAGRVPRRGRRDEPGIPGARPRSRRLRERRRLHALGRRPHRRTRRGRRARGRRWSRRRNERDLRPRRGAARQARSAGRPELLPRGLGHARRAGGGRRDRPRQAARPRDRGAAQHDPRALPPAGHDPRDHRRRGRPGPRGASRCSRWTP